MRNGFVRLDTHLGGIAPPAKRLASPLPIGWRKTHVRCVAASITHANPRLRDAMPGIKRRLRAEVVRKAGIRNLDHEQHLVLAPHDRHTTEPLTK